ncbi:MyrrCad domain-containing protein [Mycoplasma leachii]|uniref:MyrrCad domain-containing protein n=1 Tax=Mycoplasma leachii TaxID=2105 RepID=UPI003DA41A2C
MFGLTGSFNQDLSKWNVSKVKNFKKMFYNAKKYNNNDKPLKWKDKLISAQNMESMFEGASSFKHSLQDWKLETEVNNKNFGLITDKQPKWKEKVTKPTAQISIPSNPDISSRSDESESNEILSPAPSPDVMPTEPNNNLTPTTPNNEVMRDSPSTEDKALEAPIEPKISDKIENNDVKKENETSIEDKSNSLKNDIYKIPAKPNTIIKPASSNVAVITGTVIGTFTVLGIGVGTGYYYRKNLKNFYLNSANKTKDLYFKSKNKIKDKLSKIKSKK